MFFKNKTECEQWARLLGIDEEKLKKSAPFITTAESIRLVVEDDRHRSLVIARTITSWLESTGSCLLWIHEYGIWPSSENWHLYYKLKSSYGNSEELSVSPGHFLLEHEKPELTTFVELAIHFGWGAHILPSSKFPYIYLSHDGWLHIEATNTKARVLKDIDTLSLPLVENY